jgi:hypothetical protein
MRHGWLKNSAPTSRWIRDPGWVDQVLEPPAAKVST